MVMMMCLNLMSQMDITPFNIFMMMQSIMIIIIIIFSIIVIVTVIIIMMVMIIIYKILPQNKGVLPQNFMMMMISS